MSEHVFQGEKSCKVNSTCSGVWTRISLPSVSFWHWIFWGTPLSPVCAPWRPQWSVAVNTDKAQDQKGFLGHLIKTFTTVWEVEETGSVVCDAYADPGMLESICSSDSLSWVNGQHLVDQVFGLSSHCVPLWRGELVGRRQRGHFHKMYSFCSACFSIL